MRAALIIASTVVVALAMLYFIGVALTRRAEPVADADLKPALGAKFIQARSGRVHYVDVGSGPPILLMHGSGRSLADWQQGTMQALSRHHRVIAFDYYGNGFSEHNSRFTYGYGLWVQEAVDLLDALHIAHVTVVGQSVGGALACILAADHPDRVDHVVTIGTGMQIEPQQFLPVVPGIGEILFARMTAFGDIHSERHRAALEAAYRVQGTRAAVLQYIRRQMTIDGLRLLFGTFEDIKAPVLHLSGSRDAHIAPAAAQALTRRTRGRFESIPGVGHDAHIEAPQIVAADIEEFLRSTPQR